MILITGGCGFIGANFILNWLKNNNEPLVNLDALTYAGNTLNLSSIANNKNYKFIHGNILDFNLVEQILRDYKPRAIIHFAAESHVDQSINGPEAFIHTNINGTYTLLNAALRYWDKLNSALKEQFRFLHVSTDEVFGSLDTNAKAFTEKNLYEPNSPYSASKAASDHLVRAWFHTYGLPVLTTHCSNNYGPLQFPEKFIPLIITNALANKMIPIYGDGKNIRDWLYVTDHCDAIEKVLLKGMIGSSYNIGGNNEKENIEIVKRICTILDELVPRDSGTYQDLIAFVQDRAGHDKRYAINAQKIQKELQWQPKETFDTGIKKTVLWYLNNLDWLKQITLKQQEAMHVT